MNEINERFILMRKELGLSQRGLGEAIGLSNSGVSNIENGIRNVTDQHIKLLRSEFNLNENWLRTGEGKMFQQSETFSLDEEAKKSNLSELEIAIMRSYMSLDRATRDKLMDEIEAHFKKKYGIETAATVETTATTENIDKEVEEELDILRQELKAEKKGKISSASREQDII